MKGGIGWNFKLSYNFNTVLYQFLETGTSDKTCMGRDQELKWLAFSLYPISFFLYSPCKGCIFTNKKTNLTMKINSKFKLLNHISKLQLQTVISPLGCPRNTREDTLIKSHAHHGGLGSIWIRTGQTDRPLLPSLVARTDPTLI